MKKIKEYLTEPTILRKWEFILILVTLIFATCSLVFIKGYQFSKELTRDIIYSESVETPRNELKRVNSSTFVSNSTEYILDIPTNLTKNSNLTSIPSGTWFAYFSITPSDNSGIRWTNTTGAVYHLEYVVRGAVVSYVKYEYIGGLNYEWKIGTLTENNAINEIGFSSIVGGYLVSEKRDATNPEQIVSSLDYFNFFTSWFLLDYNNDYELNGGYPNNSDIRLKVLASQQYIDLSNTYTINNQLQSIQNLIPYKFNNEIEEEYQAYYGIGYAEGLQEGTTVGTETGKEIGKAEGIEQVTQNPNQYDLYTENQYLNYGEEKYQEGEIVGLNSNINTNWLISLFGVMTSFANIEIFPNIKLIYLPGVMIIFSFVRMLFKWFK